jgi:hypothetical protein
METIKIINAIYKSGKIIDPINGEVIALKENAQIKVIALGSDIVFRDVDVLTREQMINELENQKKNQVIIDYKLIANRKEIIHFEITRANLDFHATFQAELLEDLFLIQKEKSLADPRGIKLYSCKCKLTNNEEDIPGNSLSDLYKNTYINYLGKNGSPSANAFETFYFIKPSQMLSSVRDEWKLEIEKELE